MLEMGLLKSAWLFLLFCVFPPLRCCGSELSVKFLEAPPANSRFNSTKFVFQAFVDGNRTCSSCNFSCKLDDHIGLDCHRGKVFFSELRDGNHKFEVCANATQRFGCGSYDWTVDTVPPTAYVTASMPFTSAQNVSVNITFTEPCIGEGGFSCSSVNACDLLVYGAGQVIPSSFTALDPYLRYSLLVGLAPDVQYGRIVLVMGKDVCSDASGNKFKRAADSRFFVHFDRRNVIADLRTHVPEKLLLLDNQTRMVQATNDYDKLMVYLYFSEPVLNSSAEILSLLSTDQGELLPIDKETNGNRRFAFMITNTSRVAVVTVTLDSNSITSRHGKQVSPVSPLTFLYDTEKPHVVLNTTSGTRTRQHIIPIWIKFMKPVFGFNSSFLSISGGHLWSFEEINRSIYVVNVLANTSRVSVNIPENVTEDVAGNKNLASNVLEVKHYSVPAISSVFSAVSTSILLVTSFVAGLLTLSTASLLCLEAFPRPSPSLTSDPTRTLFRTACHIQVFALSRWLPVTLPVEYYELVSGLRWIIPYFPLPWESEQNEQFVVASNPNSGPHSFISKTHNNDRINLQTSTKAGSVSGLPLTAMEYSLFFESLNPMPVAEHVLNPRHSTAWRDFCRIMFWIAIIGGSLVLLHVFLCLILRFKKTNSAKKRNFGALVFPRFELFLLILVLPSICKAARSLIQDYFKRRGSAEARIIVGALMLCLVVVLLLALFLFLSIGITLGKLQQYKEIHQEGQKFHWYQEFIRVTLGPGKKGQWTWKNQPSSVYLTVLGPLFEDLRGPPKYMLSQISGSNPLRQDDRIIASDDETEDAEAPCIQKLFGTLRIYYTFLETVKRVSLGILSGAFMNNETSRTPIVFMLCITSFQLFFLVLKKPFIKKKVQLVEIISISCQVGVFATCLALVEKKFPEASQGKLGIFMVVLFLIGFLAQMSNEWYALYKQTKRLDQNNRSFLTGAKMVSIGLISVFLPLKLIKNKLPMNQQERGSSNEGGTSSENKYRSSGSGSPGSTDKPWHKQLREIAKASFTRDGKRVPRDPSGSHSRWSGFWTMKRSGSSSKDSSSDFRPRPRGLYKDLEAIFASK